MFNDDFRAYKSKVSQHISKFPDMTEEATKTVLIMPFLMLLGYDVFDPNEILPEYTCDVATKKGEKIDYAIMRDGDPVILVEAKRAGLKLQKQQQDQLYRYFSTNRCRIAVLTNGITYHFFSDINYPNVMDDDPFLSFNVLEDDEELFLSSLEQFHKENFNIKEILSKAVFLKYVKVVEQTLKQDLINPSDELVKYFLSRPEIKTGARITTQIIEKHRDATAEAMRKVMGVTINSVAPITSADAMITPPEEQIEDVGGVIGFVKQLPGNFDYQSKQERGVNSIYITRNNNTIGRIRVSKKRNAFRFDYTDLFSGKLYFVRAVEDCEQAITNTDYT
ncbi:MAG: type I restriction endonuclease [Lachnospiraceae bacterium]|nr:type I restriction endonuclease [Ruminococcus sp.]MCM1273992.1 type I restriction endonuclease [Lachnospiraceae bacterium]